MPYLFFLGWPGLNAGTVERGPSVYQSLHKYEYVYSKNMILRKVELATVSGQPQC